MHVINELGCYTNNNTNNAKSLPELIIYFLFSLEKGGGGVLLYKFVLHSSRSFRPISR